MTPLKEQIIKEFVEKITDYGFNDEYGYYSDWADGVRPIIQKYVDIILDRQLEEIRKDNEIIPKFK